MIKSDHQLRHKKQEKPTNLYTYVITINIIPHVFGRSMFCRTYTQIQWKTSQKCATRQSINQRNGEKPIYLKNLGSKPTGTRPRPT
jgi:hypothetical protein